MLLSAARKSIIDPPCQMPVQGHYVGDDYDGKD